MSKLLVVISLFFSAQAFAKVTCKKGVQFESSMSITKNNGKDVTLDLNGVGLKKALFLDVFYAALYLDKSLGQSADVIINSNEHKVGIVHTLRKLSRQQLVDIFDDEFERLCGTPKSCKRMRPHHEQFISYIRDLKKNERLYMVTFPDRFEVEINQNETFQPIRSPEYSRLLQNLLFGPDAADAELKKGLLGQKKICK